LAAQAGDRKAAARVAAALLPRVRNLVRYLIRGDRDVDDVVQEALVALLRGLPGYRGEGSLRSWADRIVARCTFGWLERRSLRDPHVNETLSAALEPVTASAPDEYLLRRQAVALLDGLPFEQRHALVLHYVLEMSVTEIAEETRAPVETIRSRLRLGRTRMREALTPSTSQKVSGCS
jgi:RNA polymerase sigma-70 factor (ECF subfamily)